MAKKQKAEIKDLLKPYVWAWKQKGCSPFHLLGVLRSRKQFVSFWDNSQCLCITVGLSVTCVTTLLGEPFPSLNWERWEETALENTERGWRHLPSCWAWYQLSLYSTPELECLNDISLGIVFATVIVIYPSSFDESSIMNFFCLFVSFLVSQH